MVRLGCFRVKTQMRRRPDPSHTDACIQGCTSRQMIRKNSLTSADVEWRNFNLTACRHQNGNLRVNPSANLKVVEFADPAEDRATSASLLKYRLRRLDG